MAADPAPASAQVHPLVAAITRLLPVLDLTILCVGALAFLLVFWTDRGRPSPAYPARSRVERLALSAAQVLAGVLLALTSIRLENAIAIRLTARGEGLAPFLLCVLLAYLGFSSLGLALSAYRARPAPLLARLHPFLAALAAIGILVLMSLAAAPVRKSLVFPLLLAIASLVLGLWQLQRMGNAGDGGGTAPEPRTGSTLIQRPGPPTGFPPELLNRFSEPELIGSGGISRVFRARRKETGEIVAVKVPLALDEATGMSFLKEMRTWESLAHGNIVRVTGANILPVPYVEMEYLPRSLADLGKPLDVSTAARIVAGIARGLAFAHGKGIVHRDLKPGNILLTDALEPKIGDWGLSRSLGGATATDITGFSPRYAAPEQLDPGRFGRPDGRTDIYGAGCIFYELVAGKPPFTGESVAEIAGRILSSPPVPPSVLNPAAAPVDGIILRCLEKDPARRFQTAGDLEQAILGYLRQGT